MRRSILCHNWSDHFIKPNILLHSLCASLYFIFCTSFLIVTKESHIIPLPQGYSVKASLPRIRIFLKKVMGRYHIGVFRLEARLAVKRGVFLGLGGKGCIMPYIQTFINVNFAFFRRYFSIKKLTSPQSHISQFFMLGY